jgi:hypothetical protein
MHSNHAAPILAVLTSLMAQPMTAAVDERDNRGVQAPRSSDPLEQRADALVKQIEGVYTGTWPGAFAKLPGVDTVKAWAVWKRLDLPAFSSRVLFHEVRENDANGRVLRQRIVAFGDEPDRTHNYLTMYPLLEFDKYSRADLHPEKLATLRPSQLFYFGRGCQVNMIGDYSGRQSGTLPGTLLAADRASCVILYPDMKSRYNQFEIRVRDDEFTFFEAAYDLDGNFLAGGTAPNRFTRIVSDSSHR